MFGIGLPELLIIIFVIILFVNPKEFPGFFRKIGRLVQEIREMRETFTRGMGDLEREFQQAKGSESKPTEPSGDGMVIHSGGESLPVRRRLCRESSPRAPTAFHICFGTGMGERVVFQGIIRHALEGRGDEERVVSVAYEMGGRYAVKDYATLPHEIWTLPWPNRPKEFEKEIALKIRGLASSVFPQSESITVHDYAMGEPAATVDSLHGGPPTDSLFETRELYAYYANTVAPVGIYPEFTVDANILRSVRETLAKRVEAFGKHAVIALHCRQRSNFPQKNPFAADMARLARRLKEHRFGLVLFPDREGPLPEMQDLCDYECPLDPSFQEPASILKLCGAFIGGDSGPGHLAAAVGTPVLTLRPPRSPWVNGPFCASAKLAFVEGNVIEDGGRQALSFDVEAAVRSLFLLLDSRFS